MFIFYVGSFRVGDFIFVWFGKLLWYFNIKSGKVILRVSFNVSYVYVYSLRVDIVMTRDLMLMKSMKGRSRDISWEKY